MSAYIPSNFREKERRLKIRAPSENPPIGKSSRKNIIKKPIEERER